MTELADKDARTMTTVRSKFHCSFFMSLILLSQRACQGFVQLERLSRTCQISCDKVVRPAADCRVLMHGLKGQNINSLNSGSEKFQENRLRESNRRWDTSYPPRRKRKPRSFGNYVQDPRDDITKGDEDPQMYQLLQERTLARKERDWQRADRILKQLEDDYGLKIYDGPAKIISRQDSEPLAVIKERYEKLYGPQCHPYTWVGPQELDPFTCPITISDIHNILCRRLYLKSKSRFCEADSLTYELSTYGIEVRDDMRQWRSDGKVLFLPEWSKPPTQTLSYTETGSKLPSDDTKVRIAQLIRDRAIALARHDWNLANALRYELYKAYHVTVDDKNLTWQLSGDNIPVSFNLRPPFRYSSSIHLPTSATVDPELYWAMGEPYRISALASSKQLSEAEEARVEQLLMQRDILRCIGHFLEADSIQFELWHTYEVDVKDPRRLYCVGQRFRMTDESQALFGASAYATKSPSEEIWGQESDQPDHLTSPQWWDAYQNSGIADDLGPDEPAVSSLIRYLSTQQQRNPNIVDRLMFRLEEEYGIVYDGKTWNLKDKAKPYLPETGSLDDLTDSEVRIIQELVDQRNEELIAKNKSMAEILQAGLRSKYGVVIDDEKRSWYLDSGVSET